MNRLFSMLIVAIISSVWGMPESKAEILWQTTAGGCVPWDDSIQNDRYDTSATGLQIAYNGTTTNTIYLACPVTSSVDVDGKEVKLVLYYNDNDGSGSSAVVFAELWSLSRTTGSVSTSSLCSVTSNTSGTFDKRVSASCGTLDTDSNIYWVYVYVDRVTTSDTPKFYAVEFEEVVN